MINSILISNRGEIASRIIKTCKKLGIKSIALFSSAEPNALHVTLADEAYCIGDAESKQSYLAIDKIIALAKKLKVDAIHPGYGFLSENAEFAQACKQANIIYIGPHVEAIKIMGDKAKSKKILESTAVPLLPGYHGDNQEEKNLLKEAEKIGYPILLKAAAGGGGKGMRLVTDQKDFKLALASAKREAKSSFANDHMIIEKYLENPRHIEIQLFSDQHGNHVHLFERDCSTQRRYQKVIEESPAPHLSPTIRKKMGDAAIDIAKAINYVGAGTVEFLLTNDDTFYFMEMNTRLQVEHPVTEFITGQDLVEWQIRVANNQPLPLNQKQLEITGHAIEVRLYAEDPNNQFLPSIGHLNLCQFPEETAMVRCDVGIKQNDTITPYYDPLLAKIICAGNTRQQALARLQQAINHCFIVGVKTNCCYLSKIIKHRLFQEGKIYTLFLDEHPELQIKTKINNETLAFIALCRLFQCHLQTKAYYCHQQDENSPWATLSHWRLNFKPTETIDFNIDNTDYQLTLLQNDTNSYCITIDDEICQFHNVIFSSGWIKATHNGKKLESFVHTEQDRLIIWHYGEQYEVIINKSLTNNDQTEPANNKIIAPMPGTVTNLFIQPGNTINKGEKILTLEAMKMEHVVIAPYGGKVSSVLCVQGDFIKEGTELVLMEE